MGTKDKPRVAVFRSNKHLYLQLVDDTTGKVLASVSDLKLQKKEKQTPKQLGALLAKRALELGLTRGVFDRSGYKYHGNVKAVRQGMQEGGFQV